MSFVRIGISLLSLLPSFSPVSKEKKGVLTPILQFLKLFLTVYQYYYRTIIDQWQESNFSVVSNAICKLYYWTLLTASDIFCILTGWSCSLSFEI